MGHIGCYFFHCTASVNIGWTLPAQLKLTEIKHIIPILPTMSLDYT